MRKILGILLTAAMMLSLFSGAAFAAGMTPGTYTETVTGMFPDLVVEVTVSEDAIESVTVVSSNETSTGIPALTEIPAAIVENQSIAIDVVTGRDDDVQRHHRSGAAGVDRSRREHRRF